LANGELKGGRNFSEWRGTDEDGLPVCSGVYFYELVTASSRIVRKMLLMR
jgi:hypothetical protein